MGLQDIVNMSFTRGQNYYLRLRQTHATLDLEPENEASADWVKTQEGVLRAVLGVLFLEFKGLRITHVLKRELAYRLEEVMRALYPQNSIQVSVY